MKELLKYLKNYRKECVLAPLMKMLEATFELIVPLVMAAIVDIGIQQENHQFIWLMCAVLIFLGIVGLISAVTAQYFAAKAAIGFGKTVKEKLFTTFQRLSFSQLDKLGSDTMLTRMTADVNQAQNGVNQMLRLFLRSPFIVFGAMIMAFTVNVRSALIFAVLIPALSVVVFGIMLISIPLFGRVQRKLDVLLRITRENMTGVRVIRAFNRQENEIKRFDETNGELTSLQLLVGRFSAAMNPLTYVLVNLALMFLIWRGGLQVHSGSLTQGELIALINYMSQILVELIKLANLIFSLNKASASGSRIAEVLRMEPDMEYPLHTKAVDTNESGVVFDHVSLSYYKNAAPAIEDISFSAKPGQLIGIIGGTGSGKSTLIHALCRFYDVTNGEVRINGINVKDYSRSDLRRMTGIVMQKSTLFSGTVADNLHIGDENANEDAMRSALQKAQALDFVERKDGALYATVSSGGSNFSGGQRQRLSIARTIAKNAPILILDDSTSALDYVTEAALLDTISNLPGKPITFIVSQKASAVARADQIIVLEDGKMAGIGTSDSLRKNCEIYREIYQTQFPEMAEVRK